MYDNCGKITAITLFTQDHRFWYQSKARMQLVNRPLTYILSFTVSKLLRINCQISAFDMVVPRLHLCNTLVRDESLNSGTGNLASVNYKHRSIVGCEMYFDSLNCVDVAHECNGRTDGQTDRTAFSNSAL